jgi:glycosyl hydrolase family 115 (putative glucuronidase)/glycosyl hydrolase family 115
VPRAAFTFIFQPRFMSCSVFSRRHFITLSVIACAASSIDARAQFANVGGRNAYVTTAPAPGRFPLSVNGRATPIVVSASDYAGVIRVANDVSADIERVTAVRPTVVLDSSGRAEPLRSSELVIVGTLGRSPIVDRLVREKKVDVSGIAGQWEASVLQVVRRPLPGVEQALVIAGSDKRGTIYGAYDLSAKIGVSPWYWWADVAPAHQASLFVLPGRFAQKSPAVKYRGIFINDEAPALSGWARATFGGVGFNHEFYEKVFELLLRMKGNYLWPAMWGNAFADDDSLNASLAEEYGVVMGTSHHEPMTRAQQEWHRYGKGPWNYELNDSTLRAFWRGGIQRMVQGHRENIVTIGMRGDGDMPMTEGSNIALLERIVADQRKIIADVTGRPASETPQLWALYKEVQDYYDKGMRVPDDVTLLFSDDNWGNIRRLPSAKDRLRAGGFGVYYHFDYVGGPRNYKWINTNNLARVWEQMHLAYESGANRIWIVNVGDIKPMELPTQFFLDYAWNPDAWTAERIPEYTSQWAEQQFGPDQAAAISELLTEYMRYASRRKPELLSPDTYSVVNYNEAENVTTELNALLARARDIGHRLPPSEHDAFYELVMHPIGALATVTNLYVTVARNRLYATQGRASTNALAEQARRLFDRDAAITRYYNDTLAHGKWPHMMDQTHIGYTYWQEPPRNVMPRVDVIQMPTTAELGVSWEGMTPFPGPGGPRGAAAPQLPPMDSYQRQSRWIDVFNRGSEPAEFKVTTGAPWLRVTPSSGALGEDVRLSVTADWDRVALGISRVPITIAGPNERRLVVEAVVANLPGPKRDSVVGFVEGAGYVSMDAQHHSRAVGKGSTQLHWQRIADIGRTGAGMTALPVTAASETPGGSAPHLEYRVFMFDSGTVTVRAYLSPTLNFSGRPEGLRYAMSFDDEPPQIVNVTADSSLKAWEQSVSDNITMAMSRHTLARAGEHTLKFWMVDPGVVLQKIVIDAGGVRPSYLGPPESFYRPGTTR